MEAWSAITRDSWALSILRKGYRIPFAREPSLSLSPILFPVAQQHFMDAYLHIPIHPASRKYLRFSLESTIYQFRALPFKISTALFVFTNLMEIVAGHIRSLGPNIYQYFDDWLVHRLSQESLLSDFSVAWEIITSLGLIPNPLKSDLVPSQDFVYAGMRFPTHIGIVRVPEESSKFLSFYFGFYRFNSLPPENFCPCWDHSMLQQI